MGFKTIIALFSILFLTSLIFFYFIPFNQINFSAQPTNSNFSIEGNSSMQYYSNLRFSGPNISYQISNCPLQKQNEMISALNIIENSTILKFYSVNHDEEISITCEEKNIPGENLGYFIAGEGGPTNIIRSGNFALIKNGQIMLIRNSNCPKPNIAIHELLHVLGFPHSTNSENVMYNITHCDQTIGDDTIQLINNLYSIPSYSDLSLGNVSAIMEGRLLNLNVTIENGGLVEAGNSTLQIYADGNLIKELNLDSINAGYGRIVHMENVWVSQINVKEIQLVVVSRFNELDKENNKINLEINKV
ncbi:Matrixin [uncultured archaeon]|nr:Matrixin [uncultured archaeon]